MRFWFDAFLLVLLPATLNSAAISGGAVPRATATLLFLVGIFRHLVFLPAGSIKYQRHLDRATTLALSKRNWFLFCLGGFILFYVVAEFRGIYEGVEGFGPAIGFMAWSLSALVYFAILSAVVDDPRERLFLLGALVAGMMLFTCVNFAGYALGKRGVADIEIQGPNKILSMVGIVKPRVLFPFTNGLNNFAVLNCVLLTASIGCFKAVKSWYMRSAHFVAGACGLGGVVLVDSRMALLAAAGALGVSYALRPRARRIAIGLLPYFLLIAPLVVLAALQLLHASGLEDLVRREGAFATKLGLASGRDAIWSAVFGEMLSPKPIHWIGYGLYGQITSGITHEFSWVFSEAMGMTSASLHDAMLQVFIDAGYLGVGLWFAVIRGACQGMIRLEASSRPETSDSIRAYLAVALCILFYGITEVAGLPYQPDVFIVFLLVLCLMVSNRDVLLVADGSTMASANLQRPDSPKPRPA